MTKRARAERRRCPVSKSRLKPVGWFWRICIGRCVILFHLFFAVTRNTIQWNSDQQLRCAVDAARLFRSAPAAAIFGLGGSNDNNRNNRRQQRQGTGSMRAEVQPYAGQASPPQSQGPSSRAPPWDQKPDRPPPPPPRPPQPVDSKRAIPDDVPDATRNQTTEAETNNEGGKTNDRPPPPPRPAVPADVAGTDSAVSQQSTPLGQEPEFTVPPPPHIPPPPPIGSSATAEQRHWQQHEPPPQGQTEREWIVQQMPPPPPHPGIIMNSWGEPGFPPPPNGYVPNERGYGGVGNQQLDLQELVEDYRQREHALLMEIQNLTLTLAEKGQREERQVRQLDVLTERVMDVEADSAATRNELVEAQANCTDLLRLQASLEEDLEEWARKCGELNEQRKQDESKIADLTEELAVASAEAEDLAMRVERHRLSEEGESHVAHRHQRKQGFFGWLFGWGRRNELLDQEWDETHEKARSTLIRALQSERANVLELEGACSSLQQNNSAISEQVKSRDLIIDELNDRVAVFEEDRVVLKAALKQLQKEMNDEAPKTQKLYANLKAAQEEVERLRGEMDSLMEAHRAEAVALQQAISQKQATIQATESNMTVIGAYVDKLEERLADFMVARRELEERRQKYNDYEKLVKDAEQERDAMKAKVVESEKEHEELKGLLEELVGERSKLSEENIRLTLERDDLRKKEELLRQSSADYETAIGELRRAGTDASNHVAELEDQIEAIEASRTKLEGELCITREDANELRARLQAAEQAQQDLENRLAEARAIEPSNPQVSSPLENQGIRSGDLTSGTVAKPEVPPQRAGSIAGLTSDDPPEPPVTPSSEVSNVSSSSQHELNQAGGQPVPRTKLPIGSSPSPIAKLPVGSAPSPVAKRNVPFRKLRKFLAKTTGIHGLFTRPSTSIQQRVRRPPSGKIAFDGIASNEPKRPEQIQQAIRGNGMTSPPSLPINEKSKRNT